MDSDKGKVYLVGGGPGDPGLITVKGLRRLQQADVVVYDRLVDVRLLEHARKDAERVYVGKGPDQHAMSQQDINRLLVDRASNGQTVVRLKGGDPFVFGRGGEEALALAEAGLDFEVVPGVTSAVAAPAYAGVPVTHRGIASSVTIVSASEDPTKEGSSVRWDALAKIGGTIVALMGWSALDKVAETLMAEGMSPDTPVALVHWGTEPHQKTVSGTLRDIRAKGTEAGLTSPVTAVIGEVADLRERIRWFDKKPLFGKTALVTRSRSQASALSSLLEDEGARAVELPTIRFERSESFTEMDLAIESLGEFQWVVFTSANGVEAFFDRMKELGRDARRFGGVNVASIGPATSAALAKRGVIADIVPQQYVAESLLESLSERVKHGDRMLLPRADIGRDVLDKGLTTMGARVQRVVTYRTVTPPESKQLATELLSAGSVDVVTFTSSSTVENLIGILEGDASKLKGAVVACIGPITAASAEAAGLQVDVVASEHTIPGLVDAIKGAFLT